MNALSLTGRDTHRIWLAAVYLATTFLACGASLRDSVAAALMQWPLPEAGLGVEIVSLDTGRVIARTNNTRPFVPASTTKVLTTSLALDRLGGDYRIETTLLASALPNRQGVLNGDLFVVGRGDPSLQWRGGTEIEQSRLGRLVDVLLDAGVRDLRGDLVLDATYFSDAPYGAGWAWDDLDEEYGAPVSALTVNNNSIQLQIRPGARPGDAAAVDVLPLHPTGMNFRNQVVTGPSNQPPAVSMERLPGSNELVLRGSIPQGGTGVQRSVPVADPVLYFGDCFAQELKRRGVRHSGGIRVARAVPGILPVVATSALQRLGSVYSAPLVELVRDMMKPSDNTQAQLLWLQCGAVGRAYPTDIEQSWPAGESTSEITRRQLAEFLNRVGVEGTAYQIEDGAGLSRANLITPASLVTLLRWMDTQPWGTAFRESLPIGGQDGTLRGRFTSGSAKGRVQAKTGSLRNVTTLAGYVTSAAGEQFAFAILINQNMAGAAKARAAMDRVVELLANETARSD